MVMTWESREAWIEYNDERARANAMLLKAVNEGEITRSHTCELCGDRPDPIRVNHKKLGPFMKYPLRGHHWNGHKNRLDIWWICPSCDGNFMGRQFHCGQITKAEARSTVFLAQFSALVATPAPRGQGEERCQ